VGAGSSALIAGARLEDGRGLWDTRRSLLAGVPPLPIRAGTNTNTTIGVIATDAKLSKTQAQRLAQIDHKGVPDDRISCLHTSLRAKAATLNKVLSAMVDNVRNGPCKP